MTSLPDSGDPGNMFQELKIDEHKPAAVSDKTWARILENFAEVRELATGGEAKAEGGQAVVFEGKERQKPGRPVAIKVYKRNTEADRKLFEREVSVVGSIHLPRDLIVQLYDVCRDPDVQPFLVLERIQGVEPLDYVQKPEPMPIAGRIDLFERFCREMQRLHHCNLVLRDVNARNVLIESGGKIRFIDFASATEHVKGFEHASMSIPLATPDCVPIEVIRGEIKASQRTDLYAASGHRLSDAHREGEGRRAQGSRHHG